MKFLSAKNKKTAIMIAAVIGAAFLFSSIYGSIKAGVKEPGAILKSLWEDLKSLFTFGNMIAIAAIAGLAYAIPCDAGVTEAVLLGVLTTGAGVVTTINTTYVPKRFHYVSATQLTGVKITVQGDGVIFDSDANGLNHCGVNRLYGQVTNGYTFTLSNGIVTGKNVIWEFTNGAAATPSVYVESDQTFKGDAKLYLQLLRQAVLANSGQDFTDFATLSLPSLAATDIINVFYNDGTQQQLNRQDLLERLQYTQNVVNTPVYTIDNFDMRIKRVNVIAAAQQTAYVQRWASVGGGMVSQVINN